jgi:branched-chain amino acid transport system substrate-binding protein
MRAARRFCLLTALLSGCSLTTAGGLSECETSADCNSDQVCTDNYCLPQPLGCGTRYGELNAPNAVQIGAVLPLSLSATDPGQGKDESEEQGLNAILLALEEINQRGADTRRIILNVCDTAADVTRTRQQTEWLVSEKKIAALLTTGSSQTLAAAEVTLPHGVLTMSSTATSPELTTREPNTSVGLLWRTSPSDAIQGQAIATLLASPEYTAVKKVGILYLDDPYGQGLFNVITEQLERKTSKEVQAFSYPRKTSNILGPVTQLDTFNPDLTVVVGFEDDVSRILHAAQDRPNLKPGAGHQWFFTDSVKDAALLDDATVAAAIQNAYGTAPAQGAGLAFKAFQSRFFSRYEKDPSAYSFTSHSYDSMYLLGLAVAYAQGQGGQVTGLKMAEGLTHVSGPGPSVQMTSTNFIELSGKLASGNSVNVEGASGSLEFDAAGESPSPIELWQVKDNKFVRVKTLSMD